MNTKYNTVLSNNDINLEFIHRCLNQLRLVSVLLYLWLAFSIQPWCIPNKIVDVSNINIWIDFILDLIFRYKIPNVAINSKIKIISKNVSMIRNLYYKDKLLRK